jgi:heme A synthase
MLSLARFAWIVLAYNGAVILWGAFVRATGSGAGCGSHWPTCNGEIVPRAESVETLIELTHRITSGLALVAVVALVVWAFRARPRRHPVRAAAIWSLVFILLEAGIGAGLVLFEWVAGDKSLARGFVMGAHLVNTLLLLAAITMTARAAAVDPSETREPPQPLDRWLVVGIAGMFVTAASGGIAALGDTLFPARTLLEGLQADLSVTSHIFLRLRSFHPLIAACTALALLVSAMKVRGEPPSPRARTTATALIALVITQVSLGALDVLLLAPITLQMLHLAVADAVWVAVVLLVIELRRPTALANG